MSDITSRPAPLSGLRILELGHFIAAPFCTRVLADLGAEVIKVEPPGRGDPVRAWGQTPEGQSTSVWWSVHGRNKKSVSINLKDPAGIDLVRRLVGEVDAVVENFKPGQLAKWGLGPDDIAAANSDAVLVQISGFGQTGPGRDRAAFGLIGEAVGGIRHLTGYPPAVTDLPPVRTGISIGDSIAGLYGAIGLLAAIFEKRVARAGEDLPNRRVDVALTDSVLSLMEGCLPEYGYFGSVRQPHGSSLPTTAPSNAYPSRDRKWFLIGANSDSLFARLCRAMDRVALTDDPRFIDNQARVRNAEALDQEISAWTFTKTIDELEAAMKEVDVPSSRIYTVADIAADPQFRARGMIQDVADPRLGKVLHPGAVPDMGGDAGATVRWTGPEVGAHTDEILEGLLGMTATDIDRLRGAGTI
ncbi:CoA transferase [Marivibrio halodurans]|uniref:CoA transferase n=1 Tax=Marivibrio halodurans TaxID=2039722 RepID=A0A8J7S4G0_9PROT|nr:CoA transferase [Marivibrio halodurans]MBP5858373.1 CoA transferase [Marivibrio halodurans]